MRMVGNASIKSKLKHPPVNPGHLTSSHARDGREFDTRMCPGSRVFECKGGGRSGI